jgi:type IV pilus assembly protein PilC
MPRYAYTALAPNGRPVKGVGKARDRNEIELRLYERKLRDVTLREKKSILKLEITEPRVRTTELMHLSRQLAAFARAGLPLIEAARTVRQESTNSAVRRMMEKVEEGLRGGDTLADCFDRFPKIFPEFYRGILRSAELTGQLDTVLDQLAAYLERDLDARRKITSAMIYPGMIMGMSVVTVVVLSVFVLPKFKDFFASMDAELPLTTRMMIATTDFLSQWWWLILIGLGAIVVTVFMILRFESGRYLRDKLLLKIPLLGDTLRFALVERFCRILASMVSAGVSLPTSLRVSTDSLRNRVFMRQLARVSESMLEGEGLATPLARSKLFPGTASMMLRVGEETGTLDTQLGVTARFYESELDHRLKKFTAAFEPAVIVGMGLIVGFVAVSMVQAMYGLFTQVHP